MANKVRAAIVVGEYESIDAALKRFKKKVDKFDILEEAHWHSFSLKPCLAKREKRRRKRKKNDNE